MGARRRVARCGGNDTSSRGALQARAAAGKSHRCKVFGTELQVFASSVLRAAGPRCPAGVEAGGPCRCASIVLFRRPRTALGRGADLSLFAAMMPLCFCHWVGYTRFLRSSFTARAERPVQVLLGTEQLLRYFQSAAALARVSSIGHKVSRWGHIKAD